MRKLLFLFVALVASVGSIYAYKWEADGIWYYFDFRTNTVSVTYQGEYPSSCDEYSGSVIIPETITYINTTYRVTSIGEYAFYGCDNLTSITIPNSVTSIGVNAFEGCSGLSEVHINDIATWCGILFHEGEEGGYYIVGSNPLDYAHKLYLNGELVTNLVIPNSVTSIGDLAFYGCSSLTSVTIPNSVTSIGDYAFEGCYFTKENFINNCSLDAQKNYYWSAVIGDIEIDGMVIRDNTLIRCRPNVTSAIIPNSVTSIGEYAFYDCSSLTSITIPNSVTSIGDSAFEGCSKMTSITIPESVTSIGERAFEGCSSLTSVTIPNSVTIGGFAFSGCSSVTSVTLTANSVEGFCQGTGNSLLYDEGIRCNRQIKINNKDVVEITIPNSITSIGDYAFYGCSSLTSITIPNSVTSIGDSAFSRCSSLTSVTIGNSVKSIGSAAFYSCSSLSSVTINSDAIVNKTYSHDDNISHILGSQVTNYVIGDGVKGIGDYAFYSCSSLTSVTIGNSVKSIGDYAFYNTGIYKDESNWEDGVLYIDNYLIKAKEDISGTYTIKDNTLLIADDAFSDCSALTSVTIPNSVTSIGNYAFFDCSALNEIILPASIISIGDYAFSGCTKLYDIYCYAAEPPTAQESSFANYNAFIHVPCESQRLYMLDVLFGEFKYIECIEAETTPTDTIVVTPSFNDAEFIWPSNSSADSYTLAISKDGEIFCTLTFNANGQLTGIAFAPSRNGQHNAPAAAQMANGFAFTVTGLNEGANYTYDLLIQDRSGNTLQSYSGEFRTRSVDDRTVMVEYDAMHGEVIGAGTYLLGDTVTLTATPKEGFRFVRWSNDVEDNPYTFVISDNVTLSAEFEAVIHSAVENATPSQQSDTHKLLRNGQLIIIRDGVEYNAMGQEI